MKGKHLIYLVIILARLTDKQARRLVVNKVQYIFGLIIDDKIWRAILFLLFHPLHYLLSYWYIVGTAER